MANWNPKPFDVEQAERVAVFNKIAPKDNWKNPIDAVIAVKDFAECNQAAIYFTGSPLTIVAETTSGSGLMRVTAPGYYATIGA